VAAESAAFAAHEKLDNLIVLYDANDVTLDAMADKTQSEDVGMRYKAYGWDVVQINGHDMVAIEKAISDAKKNDNGKPKFIICKTIIGKGIDEVAGTNAGQCACPYTPATVTAHSSGLWGEIRTRVMEAAWLVVRGG
jgi:transketolase